MGAACIDVSAVVGQLCKRYIPIEIYKYWMVLDVVFGCVYLAHIIRCTWEYNGAPDTVPFFLLFFVYQFGTALSCGGHAIKTFTLRCKMMVSHSNVMVTKADAAQKVVAYWIFVDVGDFPYAIWCICMLCSSFCRRRRRCCCCWYSPTLFHVPLFAFIDLRQFSLLFFFACYSFTGFFRFTL